jgi:plastocyanin
MLTPLRALVVVASLGAIVLGVAGAARPATPKTTGVDPLIRIAVRITDNQITVTPKRVARLETAYFRVVNTGKLTHDFRVGGQKSPPLKHGQVGHVLVQFVERGVYLYRCALHCSNKMRGYVSVFSPIG